ncbi:MAG: cytochrome c nitrite reductase small subunit [Deltaproteobacteria bacterium]|nr:cytochrome c nitrite reductase small subunit [Deltaproteobacteria bacterium]
MYGVYKWRWAFCLVFGLLAGVTVYLLYVSRAFSYANDLPETCLNCHIMGTYYQSWKGSSHYARATCNDCHVPQDGFARKWYFKATDGLYHAAVYTLSAEPQVIRPRAGSNRVIMENCIRCHEQLVTEFTRMNVNMNDALAGKDKTCWDCHRDLAHGGVSGLGTTDNLPNPFPESPAPQWLRNML